MNIESLRNYCLSKAGAAESFPFGEETLVFKVGDKIFLLAGLSNPISFNAKCTPAWALELREKYAAVQPGYHMNKKHWNTVFYNQNLPNSLLTELIDHSYSLVFNSLPQKIQQQIHATISK
ncbi:MmcQ-like protein [Pelobium manganitolerans]|uniref:MmcQ-like protein n=1 Tax=Pelobium manganitolerans TaxID=1842495 RepID=A0A419S2F9_9SPHI|nr:MmcQ/YjbR family DNA-binding protein [Pelobium manganitolerans]RKD13172.1 MmcQ-like protein [Pelobium manganitolerans]